MDRGFSLVWSDYVTKQARSLFRLTVGVNSLTKLQFFAVFCLAHFALTATSGLLEIDIY